MTKAEDLGRPETTVERAERYLDGLHSSMWGRAFDINDPSSRHDAAVWLARQIDGFNNAGEA